MRCSSHGVWGTEVGLGYVLIIHIMELYHSKWPVGDLASSIHTQLTVKSYRIRAVCTMGNMHYRQYATWAIFTNKAECTMGSMHFGQYVPYTVYTMGGMHYGQYAL